MADFVSYSLDIKREGKRDFNLALNIGKAFMENAIDLAKKNRTRDALTLTKKGEIEEQIKILMGVIETLDDMVYDHTDPSTKVLQDPICIDLYECYILEPLYQAIMLLSVILGGEVKKED